MKKVVTIFLQFLIIVLGISALVFLLWMPTVEGRNVNSTIFEIYFNDPFLAYVYVGSVPFFMALYQIFMMLGYIRQNKIFSSIGVKAMRTIKYSAMSIIGFAIGGEIFIMLSMSDDRAGGIFMGGLIIFGSLVVATIAAVLENKFKNNVTV